MDQLIWMMISAMVLALYFLYFAIRENVRKVTLVEINEILEKNHEEKRDQVKKDRLRHYTEAFCWVPISFSLFLLYASVKSACSPFRESSERDKFLALIVISLCCFLFFLGVYLFIVSLSKKGDLLAVEKKPQPKSNYALFGSPIFEWSLLGLALYYLKL